jgi:hypothetical protein
LIGIRNDSYTTAIAIKNLQIAERASAILGRTPNPLWNAVTAGLAVPYDSLHAFHPTYEDAPPATLGSVCPLLSYPIEIPMNSRAKLNDLLHALKRTAKEGPGAMMTVTLYPVVAAELGMQHFVDSLVEPTYVPFLKPPFNVLSETPQNSSINFLTGAGGFLQQVVFGHTGLRFREEGLVRGYKPILPRGVSKVRLMNVSVRGKLYTIEVVRDSVVFHVQ